MKISPTTSTGITVTADTFVTPEGTGASTWPTGNQVWKVSRKTRTNTEVEFIGVESLTQSGTAITTGTVIRYLPSNGSSLTSQGNGITFPAGSVVELVWHAFAAESVAFKDAANTFTTNQTISSTNELRFNSSATAVYKDGSGNLTLKDAANGAKTLTTLAAASGADEKAKVSSNDTTQGYLNGKLVAGAGITLTENNDGANETLSVIATNSVDTGHTGLSSVTSGGLLVGAGSSNMTVIGPGSSGQVPMSNGTTIAMGFLLPVGAILAYGAASAPTGYLLCDGTAVSRSTYAALFTAISTTFGTGDGSTTFNVPDLRGRVAVAPDGGQNRITANNTLGASAGTADGAHTHSVTSTTVDNSGGSGQFNLTSSSVSTSSVSLLPPYQVVQYIIKT